MIHQYASVLTRLEKLLTGVWRFSFLNFLAVSQLQEYTCQIDCATIGGSVNVVWNYQRSSMGWGFSRRHFEKWSVPAWTPLCRVRAVLATCRLRVMWFFHPCKHRISLQPTELSGIHGSVCTMYTSDRGKATPGSVRTIKRLIIFTVLHVHRR